MPKRPKFTPAKRPEGWMVSTPPGMSATGKRLRKFFDKKEDAESYAAKLRSRYHQGERGGVIPFQLAIEAGQAARILEPYGVSLLEAAKDMAKRMEAEGGSETFQECLKRVLPLGETHWSDRYVKDIARLERVLPGWFMNIKKTSITAEMIRKALQECGSKALSTVETRSKHVFAVLNYKTRHRKAKEIAIMSGDEVKAMFAACKQDAERWAVGLMIYAGIRPSSIDGEITRLDWEAVSAKQIFISSEVSKTNSERIIPITPALARAIKGHPKCGPVIPPSWVLKYNALRKAAGIKAQDITRHTFASHFLAAFGEDATKNAMGHTAGSRTLFRHYRRAITEETGRVFFE